MPRPKGSKNKKTLEKNSNIDAKIAALTEEKAALTAQLEAAQAAVAEQNARLRDIKKSLRDADKRLASLEAVKAEQDAKALLDAKQQEIQDKIAALLAEGRSLDEILSLLK